MSPTVFDTALPVSEAFTQEYLEYNKFLPLSLSDGVLRVACAGRPDREVIDCSVHAEGTKLLYDVLVGNPFEVEFVTIAGAVQRLPRPGCPALVGNLDGRGFLRRYQCQEPAAAQTVRETCSGACRAMNRLHFSYRAGTGWRFHSPDTLMISTRLLLEPTSNRLTAETPSPLIDASKQPWVRRTGAVDVANPSGASPY